MKITTPNGILKVGLDTEIPITLTNPMFNEQGSHSMPFSVPWCKHNLKVLGNPERVQNATLYERIPARIQCGDFDESGTLMLTDKPSKAGIELTFLINEGSFWEWGKRTKLTELNFPNLTINQINSKTNIPYPEGICAKFPVVISDTPDYSWINEDPWFKIYLYDSDLHQTYKHKRVINAVSPYDENFHIPYSRSIRDTWKDNSWFLYVNYLIDLIIETYGFRILQNDLSTIAELNRLCVLNNTIYAYVNGKINFNALVPSISVNEFVDAIINKFNVRFLFDNKSKTCRILFMEPLVLDDSVISIICDFSIINRSQKKVSITHDESNEELAKVSSYTKEDIIEDFGYNDDPLNIGSFDPSDDSVLFRSDNESAASDRATFFQGMQFLCIKRWLSNHEDDKPDYELVLKLIGAYTEQIQNSDSNIVRFHSKSIISPVALTKTPWLIFRLNANGIGFSSQRTNHSIYFCPILKTPENDSVFITDKPTLERLNPSEFPLSFTIYRGKFEYNWYDEFDENDDRLVHPTSEMCHFASPYPFHPSGWNLKFLKELNEEYYTDIYHDEISLQTKGEFGVAERFFKHTIALFENSAYSIDIRNFNRKDFKYLHWDKKYEANNIHFFINKVEITLSSSGSKVHSVEGLTTKFFSHV